MNQLGKNNVVQLEKIKTAVYRHYDERGKLLYVGITGNPYRRLLEHDYGSEFFDFLASTKYEWFNNRTDALKTEANAIRTEKPKFNKHKGYFPRGLSVVAKILDDIGHERVAEALGVPVATVLRARWRDKLPASWLDGLERAACRPLPRSVFSFKSSDRATT